MHALAQTIAALRTHILNGVIWPDFTRLPTAEHPVLAFEEVRIGQTITLGQRSVEVLPAAHTVPAVGYAISNLAAPQAGAWVFTGDTGPNAALWARLANMAIHTLVIETAFSDDEVAVARISRHLCPGMLSDELAQLSTPTRVLITHIKPGEVQAVMSEIAAQSTRHRITAMVTGQVVVVE